MIRFLATKYGGNNIYNSSVLEVVVHLKIDLIILVFFIETWSDVICNVESTLPVIWSPAGLVEPAAGDRTRENVGL
jgi:hypothetical protein